MRIETKSAFVYPSIHIFVKSFILHKASLRNICPGTFNSSLHLWREVKNLLLLSFINQPFDTTQQIVIVNEAEPLD